jgi:hypothetical protein
VNRPIVHRRVTRRAAGHESKAPNHELRFFSDLGAGSEQRGAEGAEESEEAEKGPRHAVAVRYCTGFWEDVELGIIELRTTGGGVRGVRGVKMRNWPVAGGANSGLSTLQVVNPASAKGWW